MAAGRPLYIWGGAFVGNGVARALTRNGLKIAGYLDSSPRFEGRRLGGLKVQPPESILPKFKAFIIMASGHWEDQLRHDCLAGGLIEGRDFISFNDLAPIQPAIDISGVCNLKCQGCPRGNMPERPPAGFMGLETYCLVLDKLLREIPLLGSVQLYTWGEPLLNKDFYEILAETRRRGVLSIISTNLNLKADIERFVSSGPGLVRLSASGYGDNYEKTHTGGKWSLFAANFKSLAEQRRAQKADFEVELYYHIYQHNQGSDLDRLQEMASEAGFTFRPILGCLYPWDNIWKIMNNQPLTQEALAHQKLIAVDFEAIIGQAAENPSAKPCAQVRCFPINWDLKVLGCGGWYMPRLAENFLATPLSELVAAKLGSDLCRRCARLGIPQINFPFMADQAHKRQFAKGFAG
jgi:pyruvate-formate lyase-activating enzyme